MLFLQPSEETCRLADQKDKMPYVCEKQFRFQMNYNFTTGNIPTQTHVFIFVNNIFTPEKRHYVQLFITESFKGNAIINELTYSRHKPGMYQYMK